MPFDFTPPATIEGCEWLLAELKPEIKDITAQIQRFHEGTGAPRDDNWIKRASCARRHKVFQVIRTEKQLRELTITRREQVEIGNLQKKLNVSRQTGEILNEQLKHCKSIVRAYAPERVEQLYADLNEIQAVKRDEHASSAHTEQTVA